MLRRHVCNIASGATNIEIWMQELTNAFEAEEVAAERDHAALMRELDEVGIAMLEDHEEMLDLARSNFEEMREASKNMGNEAFGVLKASVQAKIQEAEKALVERHHAYMRNNGSRSQVSLCN